VHIYWLYSVNGESHIEEREVALTPGDGTGGSEALRSSSVSLREATELSETVRSWGARHNAPRRYLIVTLEGSTLLRCSDGTSSELGPGDILVVEDMQGKGHSSEVLRLPYLTLTIVLDEDVTKILA
jgi:hypothetical protein